VRPAHRTRLVIRTLIGIALLASGVVFELHTSFLQSRVFSRLAGELTYTPRPAPGEIVFPESGPHNLRQGFSRLPEFSSRLGAHGYRIVRQAHFSPRLIRYAERGTSPPFQEKTQSGLTILDRHGVPIYQARYPQRVYRAFDDIPGLLVDTLVFIENRELLSDNAPRRNPAVEWDRLTKALFLRATQPLLPERSSPGGSTLATQIEKYRYSPGGSTPDAAEKLRQMVSASVRSYLDGPRTLNARQRIVRDYVNSAPLGGRPGFGEVQGLGEGLWAWYGIDFTTANRLLRAPNSPETIAAKARVYKAALSLVLALRRPSQYLTGAGGRAELARLTDSYVRLLGDQGIIDPELGNAALAQALEYRDAVPQLPQRSFVEQKAVNAIRTQLLTLLGIPDLHTLDRLDLTVETTLSSHVQGSIADVLQRLSDPDNAAAMGLVGPRLLRPEHPPVVRYSVLLYQSTPRGNLLRVQADNLNQPFDINEGSKLDLGSTAKLRTLISYLEIVERLYHRFSRRTEPALAPTDGVADDPIRRWAIDYLRDNPQATLASTLEAAMARRYPASPYERFFTAGGLHHFRNFDPKDNGRVLTVAEAFNRSVNLVFIRLMRDIARFHILESADAQALLDNRNDPRRLDYLRRFADLEGKSYLKRFYDIYQALDDSARLDTLAQRTRATAYRLAAAFRSVRPAAGPEALADFLARRLTTGMPGAEDIDRLYEQYAPGRFDSNDRAYLAGVHPLELWLGNYLHGHPQASLEEVYKASTAERQVAYDWLFKTRRWRAQQQRIRIMLEQDAFSAVHRQWQRLGYPFDSLVPSHATALGASADRPAALAELMGIIVNSGIRRPMRQIEALRFAEGTPYETVLAYVPGEGERLLSPEISALVRNALVGVVESGTGRRLGEAFTGPGGKPLAVGGKTGTGDHRSKAFAPGGRLLDTKVENRNAIFTFFIDDTLFGTVMAHVEGAQASAFDFTSALAAQLLKTLEPTLQPLLLEEPSLQWGLKEQGERENGATSDFQRTSQKSSLSER
jgi:membrane peptidoglycan carboxypeptidase